MNIGIKLIEKSKKKNDIPLRYLVDKSVNIVNVNKLTRTIEIIYKTKI